MSEPQGTDGGGKTMHAAQYEKAGWATIISVILTAVFTGLRVFANLAGMQESMFLLPLLLLLAIAQVWCTIYGILWFKRMLHDLFDFHDVDVLITAIIVMFVAASVFGIVMAGVQTVVDFDHLSKKEAISFMLPILAILFMLVIPAGVLSIMFGVRLLRIPDELNGYKKVMAYTTIVGASLMCTVILAPLGGLVIMVADIFQALILFQAGKQEIELEFV